MDDSCDIDNFLPGLFHLDLNVNSRKYFSQERVAKRTIGRKASGNSNDREDNIRKSHLRDLTLRYQSIWSDLNDNDVPDPESALIFVGVLATHLGKYVEAMRHFEDALKRDKMNLNAIAGLVFVCSKNPLTQQRAADCKKKTVLLHDAIQFILAQLFIKPVSYCNSHCCCYHEILSTGSPRGERDWGPLLARLIMEYIWCKDFYSRVPLLTPTPLVVAFYDTQEISELLGRSGIEVADDELSHRFACCMADQAYAHAYDVGLTSYEDKRERFFTAIELYDRALAVGSSVISLDEGRRWYLSMATIFLNQNNLMMKHEEEDSARLPGYNRALNLLKEVIKSESNYQTALAWSYLGILLERQSTFRTTPMSVHDCGFTGCEPVDCYSKAIEIADKNPIILNRLAKVFQAAGKSELALGGADMSIQLEPNPEKNSAAYHVRARLRMELYIRDLSKCKQGKSSIPDRELLEMAKNDLETILKVNVNDLSTFIEIGQVCYFMGVDAFKESFIVDEEGVNSALVYFSKALQCDMGDVIPQLQLLRGKCLKIKGEERNAIECFKKSIELDKEGSANAQAFRWLMETLLTWFSNSEIEKRDDLATDIDSWVRLAQEKYCEQALMHELRTLTHIYTGELLHLCRATAHARKLTLTRLCLGVFSTKDHFHGSKSPSGDVIR